VLKLVRTEIGTLRIGDLAIGKYRALTPAEVRSLMPETNARTAHSRALRERRSINSA